MWQIEFSKYGHNTVSPPTHPPCTVTLARLLSSDRSHVSSPCARDLMTTSTDRAHWKCHSRSKDEDAMRSLGTQPPRFEEAQARPHAETTERPQLVSDQQPNRGSSQLPASTVKPVSERARRRLWPCQHTLRSLRHPAEAPDQAQYRQCLGRALPKVLTHGTSDKHINMIIVLPMEFWG